MVLREASKELNKLSNRNAKIGEKSMPPNGGMMERNRLR
jgi:hypothetical protein